MLVIASNDSSHSIEMCTMNLVVLYIFKNRNIKKGWMRLIVNLRPAFQDILLPGKHTIIAEV